MNPRIELRLLRYAVVVAEELNFTRAAKRLHVSQPSLSRQIRHLEKDLGVDLFLRTRRWVELTPAGRQFAQEARKAVTHAERAAQLAKTANTSERQTYTVGYCPFIDLHFLSAVRRMKPIGTARAIYQNSPYKEILSRLLAHEWEAGFVILPVLEPELVAERLLEEPLAAGLLEGHSLAKKRELNLSDLKDQGLVLAPKHFGAPFHDQLIGRLKAAGIPVAAIQEAASPHEALHLVHEGFGITLIQPSLLAGARNGLVVRQVSGLKIQVGTGIAFHRENDSPILKGFLEAVRHARDRYIQELSRDLRISA